MMNTIFIVEDDEKIRRELSSFLSRYGYICRYTADFAHTIDEILRINPSLVLLDINLPVYDGYYICRELRKVSDMPIIIVTSRDSDMDELMSMNLGADDFITKPYNTQILLARIASVLKRAGKVVTSETLSYGGATLNLSKGTLTGKGEEIELSKNEEKILHCLMEHSGAVVSRDTLMQRLWQSDEFVDDNTLTVNINRLRKKLAAVGLPDYLQTRRGQGYRIEGEH